MKFVLIFLLFSHADGGAGSPALTAEFNDLSSCTKAMDAIRLTQRASLDGHYNAWVLLDCFPKGNSETTWEIPKGNENEHRN
jgi:hypothetical protein